MIVKQFRNNCREHNSFEMVNETVEKQFRINWETVS